MQRSHQWMVGILIIAGLQLSACGQTSVSTTQKIEPAHVEHIEGSDLSRVTLTPEAAKRLDIQTGIVREEQLTRKRIVGGEVLAAGKGATSGSGAKGIWVRVPLSESDLKAVDRTKTAQVLPLAFDDKAAGVMAKLIEEPAVEDPKEANMALYYAVDSPGQSLAAGQRVRIELALSGSGTQQKIVPYTAVIYDLHGKTWTYTSPADLTFIRHPISVDYIEGDLAILTEGPPSGTAIVTVGAAELFGTEFGVGH